MRSDKRGLEIPKRDKSLVAVARPAPGDHNTQFNNAFARTFARYETAFKALADR